MAMSEAKKKANRKWDAENRQQLVYRFDKELVGEFKATCAERGDAQAAVVKQAIEAYLSGTAQAAAPPGTILDDSTLALLEAKAETYHITPSQLAATIISDWLATH